MLFGISCPQLVGSIFLLTLYLDFFTPVITIIAIITIVVVVVNIIIIVIIITSLLLLLLLLFLLLLLLFYAKAAVGCFKTKYVVLKHYVVAFPGETVSIKFFVI